MINVSLWIALFAAFLGCYFTACMIALKSYSRSKLSDLLETSGRTDELQWLIDREDSLLLITNTIRTALNFVVLLASLYLFQHETTWSVVLQYIAAFGLAGVIVSIFTIAVPTFWARYSPETLLAGAIPLLNICLTIFQPVSKILHAFDPIVRRISGVDMNKPSAEDAVTEEVLSVVEDHETSGKVDPAQRQMIEAVFQFPNLTAEQVMTPRTDIKGIEVTATLDDIRNHQREFGHSRIPVYEDNLDHIIGILYVKDLIQFLGVAPPKFDMRAVMRQVMMVPETKSVEELLGEFKGRKVHIAILLDEYGGTAGLITIEDIIEELVGDIQDEYEPVRDEPTVTRVNDTVLEVDGRLHVHDLNGQLEVDLPEGEDYDTVAGFVVATLGRIPEEGETFEFDNVRMTVSEADRTKVSRVRVERLQPADMSDDIGGNGHGK